MEVRNGLLNPIILEEPVPKFILGNAGTIERTRSGQRLRREVLGWWNLLLVHSLARHLLFAIATISVILLYGYVFGTYDQAIHIPSLKKFADPSLYPGDAFMELRFQHFSYFWFLFIPSLRLGILEPTMFLIYVVILYFTFWAIWTLTEALFQNRSACILAVLIMIFPHVPFGGWNMLEFSLLNRTFVIPFLLWAIALYLKRRIVLAFALLGVVYNFHALSANFVLAMFLLDGVLEWRKIGMRRLALAMGAFLFCALPVLVWKISSPSAMPTVNPEWLSIIGRGALANTYFVFAPFPYPILLTASGFASIALYFVARSLSPRVRQHRTLTNFMLALLLIFTLHLVSVQWFPLTILIQMQLIRAGVFIVLFAYLGMAYALSQLEQSGESTPFHARLLFIATLFPFPFVPVCGWLVQRVFSCARWRWTITLCGFGIAIVLSHALAQALGVWNPGINVYARQTPWYDVQVWARNNTPRNAVFITPSHLWSFHESDWRVFSERSTVVTQPELMEIAFAPNYLPTWRERFAAIYPGALERMDGNQLAIPAIVQEAYYRLEEKDVLGAACRYGATFFVTDRPRRYKLKQVYRNERFIVYSIASDSCSALTPNAFETNVESSRRTRFHLR